MSTSYLIISTLFSAMLYFLYMIGDTICDIIGLTSQNVPKAQLSNIGINVAPHFSTIT
ncbi:MAG: hypothetical protein LBO69_08925 [Ignavibacteria bacterium]|nr:hypothetical protein [Ignavibacteria bacterium]